MAERNYLVEGLSGAGKSSVYEELIRRGYAAVSTDRAWKTADSLWDERKALRELERPEPNALFVCGSGRNRDRFLPLFSAIFNLRIDDETMRRRLRERTNNDFGKQPEELEQQLRLNRSGEKPAGAIDVDATRPLAEVVDELLRVAACGEPTPPAWSKGASSPVAQSFVIGETVTRLEFSWSGALLARLLGAEPPFTLVLTADDRERCLARLDPIAFDGIALQRDYEESTGTAAEGVGYALLDGIAFLRDTLAPLDTAAGAVVVIA